MQLTEKHYLKHLTDPFVASEVFNHGSDLASEALLSLLRELDREDNLDTPARGLLIRMESSLDDALPTWAETNELVRWELTSWHPLRHVWDKLTEKANTTKSFVSVALLDDAGEPIAYLQSSTYDKTTLAAIAADYAARSLYDDRYDPVARIQEDHAGQITIFTNATTQD